MDSERGAKNQTRINIEHHDIVTTLANKLKFNAQNLTLGCILTNCTRETAEQ
jgi:hypothetical protein